MGEVQRSAEGNGNQRAIYGRYSRLLSSRSERVGQMQRMFPVSILRGCMSDAAGTRKSTNSVNFNNIVIVHYQRGWSDADYTAGRRGPWMHMAADRHRFKRRIRQLENILNPILTETHRQCIRLRNIVLCNDS